MMKPNIRKEIVIVEEVRREINKSLEQPLQKCASVAIIENVYAGQYVKDFSLYEEYGSYLGRLLTENALRTLDVEAQEIHSYGKAAITGINGEQEHGAALLHLGFDKPIRELLKDTLSIIPSSEKVAPAGSSIDVPLHSKRGVKVRTHYDAMEVFVEDGPRPNEIMIVLCFTTGPRPFARVGGLLLEQVKELDGIS